MFGESSQYKKGCLNADSLKKLQLFKNKLEIKPIFLTINLLMIYPSGFPVGCGFVDVECELQ